MYDVIIVGARCAGAPLAMLLARGGAKVLAVDRATFPSDIPHGHFIHRQGPARLKAWGLLDRVAAACMPIAEQLSDLGDFPLVVRDLASDGVAWGYGPRRAALDAIFVDAAIEAGAELRQAFTVDEFLVDGDRITGIRGRTPNGTAVEEHAAITVGADGRHSKLAKAVGAAVYDEAPTLLCYYFSYWSGVEALPFELYHRTAERRVIFSFRTTDDLYAVFVGSPIVELPSIRADIDAHVRRALALAPDFGRRVLDGRREERYYGATDLPNFYRKPYGEGWALVGDAGCHKDPYMALGIADALRDADLLAAAILDGLDGRPLAAALEGYERERNAASTAVYQQNLNAARFEPTPEEVLRIRQAVRFNPAEATRMTMARFAMIDPREFFNPEHLQRVLGAASETT